MAFLEKFEVRTFHLIALDKNINFGGLSWDKELERIGFKRNDFWEIPASISIYPEKKLPLDPLDWPKRYKYEDKKFPTIRFLKLPLDEKITKYYGKYEFTYLPKIYPTFIFPEKGQVYQSFLNCEINTVDDLLSFPFKMLSILPPTDYISKSIDAQKVMILDVAQKISNKLVGEDEIGVMEYFSREFIGWQYFTMQELLNDYKKSKPLSKCQLCGGITRGHIDKKFCNKEENLDCYREQERVKKAKQRSR